MSDELLYIGSAVVITITAGVLGFGPWGRKPVERVESIAPLMLRTRRTLVMHGAHEESAMERDRR